MNEELYIVRDKETKELLVPYKGIDYNNYDFISLSDFIEEVEKFDRWDIIDSEVWDEVFYDCPIEDCENIEDSFDKLKEYLYA